MKKILFLLFFLFSGCSSSVKDEIYSALKNNKDIISDSFFNLSGVEIELNNDIRTQVVTKYNNCVDGEIKEVRNLLDLAHVGGVVSHGVVYFLIGNCYFVRGDLNNSRHFYMKSLPLLQNEKMVNYLNNNLSIMYFVNGYFAQGELFLSRVKSDSYTYAKYNLAIKNLVVGNYHVSKDLLKDLIRGANDSDLLKRLYYYTNFLLGEYDHRISGGDAEALKFYAKNSGYYFDGTINEKDIDDFDSKKNFETVLMKQLEK